MWEESPIGVWTLEVFNDGRSIVELKDWKLVFWGTETPPQPGAEVKPPLPPPPAVNPNPQRPPPPVQAAPLPQQPSQRVQVPTSVDHGVPAVPPQVSLDLVSRHHT